MIDINSLYRKLTECNYTISTDTRKISPGSVFFAWKGEKHDGNIFAEIALDLGCTYAVIDNPEYKKDERYILVEDSIKMLQDLAHHHRMKFDIPVIGLTGSNGKTTTKELITAVLETQKKVISTEGNLNNHVGVPKTLLRIRPDTEIAVIEMGANHIGEIADLCRIAHPTYGIITNIGRAHIGLFGGPMSILRAKTELYRYLDNSDGITFVNGDDELLLKESDSLEKITYTSLQSDYPVTILNSNTFFSCNWGDTKISSNLVGNYNLSNIACAIAVGDYFGIYSENIKKGIEHYIPQNERSEMIETKKGNVVIKDYYNANRTSMEIALQNFSDIKTNKDKIAILGDMFELGEYADEDHIAVLEKALSLDIDKVILIGSNFSKLETNSDKVFQFNNIENAITSLRDNDIHAYILLKASQGMNFKKLFQDVGF